MLAWSLMHLAWLASLPLMTGQGLAPATLRREETLPWDHFGANETLDADAFFQRAVGLRDRGGRERHRDALRAFQTAARLVCDNVDVYPGEGERGEVLLQINMASLEAAVQHWGSAVRPPPAAEMVELHVPRTRCDQVTPASQGATEIERVQIEIPLQLVPEQWERQPGQAAPNMKLPVDTLSAVAASICSLFKNTSDACGRDRGGERLRTTTEAAAMAASAAASAQGIFPGASGSIPGERRRGLWEHNRCGAGDDHQHGCQGAGGAVIQDAAAVQAPSLADQGLEAPGSPRARENEERGRGRAEHVHGSACVLDLVSQLTAHYEALHEKMVGSAPPSMVPPELWEAFTDGGKTPVFDWYRDSCPTSECSYTYTWHTYTLTLFHTRTHIHNLTPMRARTNTHTGISTTHIPAITPCGRAHTSAPCSSWQSGGSLVCTAPHT